MALTLTHDATNARVAIAGSSLGNVAAVQIERSTDQILWKTVRGAVALAVSGGSLVSTHYDYEYAPGMTNYYRARDAVSLVDTFTRSVSNGWGTADSGGSWTNEGGVAGNYGVTGSTGWHDAVKEAATRRTLRSGPVDGEATFTVSIPVVSTGEAAQSSFIIREDGANTNFLCFRVVYLTTGFLDPRISIRVASVETTLANGDATTPYAAGDTIGLRCRWRGSTLQLKVWNASDSAEPTAWTAEANDSTFLTAGRIGFRSSVGTDWASWTGPDPLRFTYDNLRVVQDYGNGTVITSGSLAVPDLSTVRLKSPTRPFLNRSVTVVGWSDVTTSSRGAEFDVVGRTYPVAVTDVRGGRQFTLQLYVATTSEARTLEYILGSGDVLFVQTPASCPVPTGYFRVGDTGQRRPTEYGSSRVFALPMVEVAAPGPDVAANTTTWDAVVASYATWDDLVAANPDWNTLKARIADPSTVVVD